MRLSSVSVPQPPDQGLHAFGEPADLVVRCHSSEVTRRQPPTTGGNATGINFLSGELTAKRLELLHELVPAAARVAVLVNPADATAMETTLRDLETAVRGIGLKIQVLKATTSQEIHAAFAATVRERSEALFLGSDPFFTSRRVQLATLSARLAIPLASQAREIAEAGGLMSFQTRPERVGMDRRQQRADRGALGRW